MNVTRKQAVSLLTTAGLKTAAKFSETKLNAKLNELDALVDDETDMGSEELNTFLDDVLEAIEAGTKVVVASADETKKPASKKAPAKKAAAKKPASKKAPAASKKAPAKKAAAKKPASKKAPAKKEPAEKKARKQVEKDAFGCRVGSQAAALNSILTKKPQTIEEIHSNPIAKKRVIQKARIAPHFAHLIKNGFVTKTDKGYAIK